jgi:putative membrane protein
MRRDTLAAIRTHLANERTVLAYVRTSLAFLATGGGLLHFISSQWSSLIGWSLIGIGVMILATGVLRFFTVHGRITRVIVPDAPETPDNAC